MTAKRDSGQPATSGAVSAALQRRFEAYGEEMSIEQVAEVLGARTSTVYKWLGQGTIPAYRIGGAWLILTDEVKQYLLEEASNRGGGKPSSTPAAVAAAALPAGPAGQELWLSDMPVTPGQAALWWVGAHGGAGESTLEALLPDSRAAGHRWPSTPSGELLAPTVLVARTSLTGLRAVLRAYSESAKFSGHRLLGVSLIADAPDGPHPKLAHLLEELTEVQKATTWVLPWVESWRIQKVTPEGLPDAYRQMLTELRELLDQPASEGAGVS